MTSKYMSFSPQLVNERNVALNNCPTKSGRSQIYRTYYLKMKDAYDNYENYEEEEDEDEEASEAEYDDEDDDDDEDYEGEEDEEEECEEEYEEDEEEAEAEDEKAENKVIDTNATEYCCCGASEVDANEVDANEVDANEDEDENEFGCPGCNYEWRDGYKNGWRDAMKYITNKTHKEVPDTPACSYCNIVCKTRKCGGKCGGTVRYCSVECQKQDWASNHKAKCGN